MDQELAQYIQQKVKEEVSGQVEEQVKRLLKEQGDQNRAAIIASKGTLDMAYPPLILASTCAALDIEVSVFFTFYGLDIINKHKLANLKVPPIGNPAMPVPMPNILGMLPGMTAMATMMMKKWMADQNVSTIPQLLQTCIEAEVKMIGCQMTMDVMGIKREDLIDDIQVGGAAFFLEYASRCNITLFI